MWWYLLVRAEAELSPQALQARAEKGLYMLLWLLLIPAVPLAYVLLKWLYGLTLGRSQRRSMRQELMLQARRHERRGEYVSAALIYAEKLDDVEQAARLFAQGGDYLRAAQLYRQMGQQEEAMRLYERAGQPLEAAQLAEALGRAEEAARLYQQAGEPAEAARCLELSGRALAAARLYRQAGQYRKAAELLKGLGMHQEAAEMFGILLRGATLGHDNIEDFYTYARYLQEAGYRAEAERFYQAIQGLQPHYADVPQRLEALKGEPAPLPPGEPSPVVKTRSLRDLLGSGPLEPRRALRLWVEVLKALRDGARPPGPLCPEAVLLSPEGRLSFRAVAHPGPPYENELMPALGGLLYELLTGSLEGLRMGKRPSELVPGVPPLLDGVVRKCLEGAYAGVEEVFLDLKKGSRK
jgi:tetratricopeptide (TPR) repeat protein